MTNDSPPFLRDFDQLGKWLVIPNLVPWMSEYLEISRAGGHSGFPLGLISDSNFQNGGLNERATVCGVGHPVAAA